MHQVPDPAAHQLATRRLRVASIYRSFNRAGSIESLFLRNAERLAEDEDVTVFAAASTRVETAAPLHLVPVESLARGRDRLRYAVECSTFARRASRAVSQRRHEFDVIHVEGFASYDADLVTVHAVRAAELEHYFTNVEPDATIRRHLSPRLFRPQSSVVMKIERRLFQRTSPPYCICPSEAVKRDLERWHGVPADRISVVPYGVEVSRFRRNPAAGARIRAELGITRQCVVVLFVGAPFERKGLDVAVAGFLQSYLPDAELWVIGGTDREHRRVRRAGLDSRIRILGRRDPAELPAFYSAADVFVLPTQQDSWAIPVTEALAAGCPVVTSEYSGSCELITHGLNGYILKGRGSPEELASLLSGPLSDPLTRARIAARGLETVAPYDYDSFYVKYREAHHLAYELARERFAECEGGRS